MMGDDGHIRGHSGKDGSFADAAKDAVKRYEAWCKENGRTPETDVEIELRVGIQPDSSLSEYIVVLKTHD
jgi:hypothetical protein